ncbi:MAG: hypothetical protein R3244_03670 [Thermoanaerobaculia bacterium]|nr:hypothetical protein [Thermoanaerobaculia bacterium]
MALKSSFNFRVNMDGFWQRAWAIENIGKEEFEQVTKRAGERSAKLIEKSMHEFIEQGLPSWPDNHPFTIAMKSSAQQLYETGDMKRSIQIFMSREGSGAYEYLVGFPPGRAAMLALNAEFGKTITVTDRMRAFLAAKGLRLRAETKVIFIPPRPFMEPAFTNNQSNIRNIATDELEKAFSGGGVEGRGTPSLSKKAGSGVVLPSGTSSPKGTGRLSQISRSLGRG